MPPDERFIATVRDMLIDDSQVVVTVIMDRPITAYEGFCVATSQGLLPVWLDAKVYFATVTRFRGEFVVITKEEVTVKEFNRFRLLGRKYHGI